MVVSILLRNIFAESAFLFNRAVFETDVSRIRYKHICILDRTLRPPGTEHPENRQKKVPQSFQETYLLFAGHGLTNSQRYCMGVRHGGSWQ